ncbi:MAG: hypothetical protein IPK33_17130 [Gemmatimonadetes bacterium]|nr:hypothetical protein [Gemmatimonadota bacterium]
MAKLVLAANGPNRISRCRACDTPGETVTLIHDFDEATAKWNDTATSIFLSNLRHDVAFVDAHSSLSPDLGRRSAKLSAQLSKPSFAVDSEAINSFAQALAETQFLALCESRGVRLKALATRVGVGTADYSLLNDPNFTFEVKALSVVDGARGIDRDLMQSLEAKGELDGLIMSGSTSAFVERETMAYKDKVRYDSQNKDHIDVLLEKARQNMKRDQFEAKRSFLVLNTSMLPVPWLRTEGLRPVNWRTRPSPHPVTGAMWMLAFGMAGMPVFSTPEFEGRAGIEGYFEKMGILEEFPYVAGVLFVRRRIDGELEVALLMKKEVRANLFDEATNQEDGDEDVHNQVGDSIQQCLVSLCGVAWNDELDSNGWQL